MNARSQIELKTFSQVMIMDYHHGATITAAGSERFGQSNKAERKTLTAATTTTTS